MKKGSKTCIFWENSKTYEQKVNKIYKEMFESKIGKERGLALGLEIFYWQNSFRYGVIGSRDHIITAHRLSWILHNGSIPKGLLCLHKMPQ